MMLRKILTVLALFALWLLMSGIYKPLVVWLGVGSSLIAVMVVRRMDDAADADSLEVNLKLFATVRYWAWLMVEIAKSNWAVSKIILSPVMRLNQHHFIVPCTQKTNLGQTIFANSITLTPGTISVDVEGSGFLVHALSYEDETLPGLADMDARVTNIESVPE